MGHYKRIQLFFCGMVMSILLFSPFSFAGESRKIRFHNDTQHLSIHVENETLIRVLNAVGEEIGCKIVWLGNPSGRITDSFSNLPLNQAIDRIAPNHSTTVIYRTEKSDGNAKVTSRVSEIWLFEKGSKKSFPTPVVTGKKSGSSVDKVKKITGSTGKTGLQVRSESEEGSNTGFWANRLFDARMHDDKIQAVTELQRLGTDDALAAIATVLNDDDAALRKHAVESLAIMDNAGAVQLIGQSMRGDPDPTVRKTALEFFANRNDGVSRAFLNTALKDKNKEIRELAQQHLDEM